MKNLTEDILLHGAACAADLTGDPEMTVSSPSQAWRSIDECIRAGQIAHAHIDAQRVSLIALEQEMRQSPIQALHGYADTLAAIIGIYQETR